VCTHKVVCYHCMRRKELFAVALSDLSLSNKNSREPGATLEPRWKNRVPKNCMALRILLF